jgi:MFS family permease
MTSRNPLVDSVETEEETGFYDCGDGNELHQTNHALVNDSAHRHTQQFSSNFYLFSFLYSVIHGAVDCVLAYSAAELGANAGSYGGFALYLCYTLSSLFLSKMSLTYFKSAKSVILLGLVGMFIYVISFSLAVLFSSQKFPIFLTGAAVGGLGAGVLWTAQGVYYSINAHEYAKSIHSDEIKTVYSFAAIFAMFYLLVEALLQFLGTTIFLIYDEVSTSSDGGTFQKTWKSIVFGVFTSLAAISIVCFKMYVLEMPSKEASPSGYGRVNCDEHTNSNLARTREEPVERNVGSDVLDSGISSFNAFAVVEAIVFTPKLQLLLPFQISFGFSAGLIQTYINGVIVKDYIGEGYIGLFAGIVTLTAFIIAQPLAIISNVPAFGKELIMTVGGLSFAFGGLLLLVLSDKLIASWPIIILYYTIHGIARGIWENTNKAVVAEFFPVLSTRDSAFASIYFASGLSGAIGFVSYQFMSREAIAVMNSAVGIFSIFAFLLANRMHKQESTPPA